MTAQKPQKLLLVESDADHRRSLTNLLSGSGFEVLSAVDYEAATKAMEKAVPDLAVIATRLGKGPSGFVALRAFRSRGGKSVVALLPESNFEEAVSAFRLGAVDVLVKPPRAGELVAALRRGLGQSPEVPADAPRPAQPTAPAAGDGPAEESANKGGADSANEGASE